MFWIRRSCVAGLAAVAALAVGAPMASAITFPTTLPFGALPFGAGGGGAITSGACDTTRITEGQAATGGVQSQVCQGSGLSFIGPSVGQVATVMGPTIIGPAVIGTLIVSAGNAAGG
jgi:hypothetical protein